MVKLETNKMGRNDVIVTVYEEASTLRLSRSQKDKIRATNRNPRRPCGYDRRAELLAHVHQLRNGGTQQVRQGPSPANPSPKPKKRRRFLAPFRKLRFSFGRIFGERKKRLRYESIETQGHGTRYMLCCPGKSNWGNFAKRFCRLLRQLSCFWKCNKFSRDEELEDIDSGIEKNYVSR